MSTLVTHDQGSGEVVINAQGNSLPESGTSVAGNISGTNGMSSLPNSVNPVVDNGQSSSWKRSVQDDRDGSQLRINPEVPISLGNSARFSGNSSRNVSRRTIASDQERGRSSPVVPPTNVQLRQSGHRGNARPLHAVELGATAVQVPGNVFGRDVGNLQMGTVGRSQAPSNLASLINHASRMYNQPNIQNGGLHLSHQTIANNGGRTSTVGGPSEKSSILAELMRVLAEWWHAAAQREVEHETMRLDVEHMSSHILFVLMHQVKWDSFEKGQNVRKLDCTHNFHFECIKTWLLRKNSCPLCKASAVPTP
ncbi:E3 ubiquitin-protein ligase MBR1-like protein [Drosera capensis]